MPAPRHLLLGLMLLTLLVRGGALWSMRETLAKDPDGYCRLAENLINHGTFGDQHVPTAYRPPLYPLALSGCLALDTCPRLAIGGLHLVLGLVTV